MTFSSRSSWIYFNTTNQCYQLNSKTVENKAQNRMVFVCLEILPLKRNIILSNNKTNLISLKENEELASRECTFILT